jgi:hypothetical protein
MNCGTILHGLDVDDDREPAIFDETLFTMKPVRGVLWARCLFCHEAAARAAEFRKRYVR